MKNYLSLMMALLLSMSAVACSDDDNTTDDNKTGDQTTDDNTGKTGDNTGKTGDNTGKTDDNTTATTISECKLNYYADKVAEGSAFEAYAQVKADGATGKTGNHSLKAQFGYININEFLAAGANASVDTIHWVDAPRNESYSGDDTIDEFMTKDINPTAGGYGIGYRVSGDNGKTWTFCGINGIITDMSTLATNVGMVTVAAANAVNVSWCQLKWAENIQMGSEFVAYAQVYAEGVTGKNNSHDGIIANLGYVNVDDYLNNGAEIKWAPAKRNDQFTGDGSDNNDEYMNDGNKPEKTGWYALLYRFSGDNGQTWIYCGKNEQVITSMDNITNEIWSVEVK